MTSPPLMGRPGHSPRFAKRLLDLVDRQAPREPGTARELADPRGAVSLTTTRGFHFYPPLAMQTAKFGLTLS